jgi:iron complex transport system permease protein
VSATPIHAGVLHQATPGEGVAASYRRLVGRRIALGLLLAALGVGFALADLIVGSGTLSFARIIGALLHPASDALGATILWDIRMPITFTAVIAGIALALSGGIMQTVLQNPLAEPFTLGISAAAGFGAALAFVFQASLASVLPFVGPDLLVAGNAFVASLAAILFVVFFAGRRGLRTETVTLLGIAIHFVFSALLAMAQYVANADQLQGLVFWMLGSLLRATWTKVEIDFVLLLLVLPVLVLNAWAMTALRAFGDGAAVLGVRVARLRMVLLVVAALLAGGVTATIGVVGFIGLVAPHLARMLVGEDQRFALPVTAACGLIIMTAASLASKLIIPGVVLPIGMVTSLLGVPFFVAQVLRRDARPQ